MGRWHLAGARIQQFSDSIVALFKVPPSWLTYCSLLCCQDKQRARTFPVALKFERRPEWFPIPLSLLYGVTRWWSPTFLHSNTLFFALLTFYCCCFVFSNHGFVLFTLSGLHVSLSDFWLQHVLSATSLPFLNYLTSYWTLLSIFRIHRYGHHHNLEPAVGVRKRSSSVHNTEYSQYVHANSNPVLSAAHSAALEATTLPWALACRPF